MAQGTNLPTNVQTNLPIWYVLLVDGVGKLGFPIVVCLWVLTQYQPKIDELIKACSAH